MKIDKFLAWVNVRLMMLEEELKRVDEGNRKHEIYVKIRELKDVKNSYCRITGGEA